MPTSSRIATRLKARAFTAVTLTASLAVAAALALPSAASASKTQLQMFQDGGQLQADPAGALAKFRALGANSIRVVVFWYQIAPNPNSRTKPKFNATDPNAYPSANWTVWDTIVRDAAADGIKVDFTVAGGPRVWADGPSIPKEYVQNTHWAWKPNAAAYGQFMQAMGKRYSGTFTPKGQSTRLPKVSMWSLWNEPNFGEDLGPQAINDSTVLAAPMYYRNLANQGYNALKKTGHSRDTILMGELAVEGFEQGRQPKATGGLPGVSGQTRPQLFLRTLYCVDNSFKPFTGSTAKAVGCPTTAAARRKFRSQNPGLFNVTGLSIHPYAQNQSPVSKAGDKPDFIHFPDIPAAEALIDHLNRIYGSQQEVPHLQRRVRLHHQPAVSQVKPPQLRQPGDGGLLHQLGRVPQLEEPADRQLHAVPAARPAAQHRPVCGLRQRAGLLRRQAQGRPPRLPGARLHAQDQAQ